MKSIFFVCILIVSFNFLWAQTDDKNLSAAKICLPCGGGGGGAPAGLNCNIYLSTLYVDSSRATDGNGTSWANAKKTLQGALAIANRCNNISNILVAKGTYRASTTVNSAARDYSFFIGDAINIFGGYPGGAGSDSAIRNFVYNPTILDGEIQDLYEAYHTIAIYPEAGNIILDGFQVKNGFADGTGSVELEPGVNMARNVGAAIYIRDAASVKIRNCVFYSNVANSHGAAIYANNSSLTLENCVFVNNTAGGEAGAIYNMNGGNLAITNCTFYNNLSLAAGDAVYSTTGTTLAAKNCIIWGNASGWGGGGTRTITHCLVPGGTMSNNGIVDDPRFQNTANPDGLDNRWFTADDGLALSVCSPAINRGTNNIAASITKDITGDTRIINEQIDMGAYEAQEAPEITSASLRSIDDDSTDTWFYDGVTALTAKNNCRIIARLFPLNADGSVGRIKAKTLIETRDISFNGTPLVSRHYNIDDTEAAPNGINIITLYFSNTDFTNYNLRAEAIAKMPLTTATNPEQNIRVGHFRANSITGTPISYGVQPVYITPVSVTWLSPAATWRVIFTATGGLGGFFLTAVKTYEFTGNGNWSIASNWLNNERPPANLPPYYKITIAQNKYAILNISQALSKNAWMDVQAGATLTIQSGLDINGDLKTNTGLPAKNITITGQ